MVQTDISQLARECNTWRETLRNLKQEFSESKSRLQEVATHQLSKEQLKDVEHYHNQFHIQLINIHDLKQAIKAHDRKANFELSSSNQISEETLAEHENLYNDFTALEHTLQELRNDFEQFVERTHAAA